MVSQEYFKAVLKCSLTEAILSNALLKLILFIFTFILFYFFFKKVHEIWMHDIIKMKLRLMIFFLFMSVLKNSSLGR